jgi:ABC-type Fe3+-hydroxamate transport system substrate-binding protein
MKKMKFSFAALVALAAIGLTVSTNASTIIKKAEDVCYRTVTIPGLPSDRTATYGGNLVLSFGNSVKSVADANSAANCSGDSYFCCATTFQSSGQTYVWEVFLTDL